MLQAHDVAFTYRDYTKEPLSREELAAVLRKLRCSPHDVLRARDAKKQGLDGASLSEGELLEAMAANNRLVQRPILVTDTDAHVGRPPEALVDLL